MHSPGGSNVVLPNNAYRNRWGLMTGRINPFANAFNAVGGLTGHTARISNELRMRELSGQVDARVAGETARQVGMAHVETAQAWNSMHHDETVGRLQRGEITEEQSRDLLSHAAGYGGRGVVSAAPTRSVQTHAADPGKLKMEQQRADAATARADAAAAAHAGAAGDLAKLTKKHAELSTNLDRLTKEHESFKSTADKNNAAHTAKIGRLSTEIEGHRARVSQLEEHIRASGGPVPKRIKPPTASVPDTTSRPEEDQNMANNNNDKFDEVSPEEMTEQNLTAAQKRRKAENDAIIQANEDKKFELETKDINKDLYEEVGPKYSSYQPSEIPKKTYNTSFVDKTLFGVIGDGSAFLSPKAHEDARVAANDAAMQASEEAKEASEGLNQFPAKPKMAEPTEGQVASQQGMGVMEAPDEVFNHRLGLKAGYTANQNPEKVGPKPAQVESDRKLMRTSNGATRISPAILTDLKTAVDFAHQKHLEANEKARNLGYLSAVAQLMQSSGHNLIGLGATGVHKCGNSECEDSQKNAILSATSTRDAVSKLTNAFVQHHMDKDTNEGKRNLDFYNKMGDESAKKFGVSYDYSLGRHEQHLSTTGSHWEEPLLPNEYGEMPDLVKPEDAKRFRTADAWDQVINHPSVKHQLNKISIARHVKSFASMGLFDKNQYPQVNLDANSEIEKGQVAGDITLNDINSFATSMRGGSRKRRGVVNPGDPTARSGPGFLGGSVAGTSGGATPQQTIAGIAGILTSAHTQLENLPQDISESKRQITAASGTSQEASERIDDMRTRARKRVAGSAVPALKAVDALLTHTHRVRQQTSELRANASIRVRARRTGEDPGPLSIDLPDPRTGRMGGIQPNSKETRQNDAEARSIPDIVGGLVSKGREIAMSGGTETDEPRTLAEGLADKAASGLAELSRGTRSSRRIRVSGEPEITESVPGGAERVSPTVAREEGTRVPRRAQLVTGSVSPDERDETPRTSGEISASHAKLLSQIEDAHRSRVAPLMGAMKSVADEHAKSNPGAPRLSTEEVLNHPNLSPKVKNAFIQSHLVRKQQIDQANRRFAQ